MPDIWLDVDAAVTVPVNLLPLLDDTDFKSREPSLAYNAAGMDLVWNFITTAGAITQTAVTPTDTGGNYDWTHVGDGIYKIEIPASGGASINNDTEGFGWFSGLITGVLPWRGPVIGFRAAGLNNALVDSAWSATRGLAGTALPDAAADAAGGLPISDAGALDLDAQIKTDIDAILEDTGTTLPAAIAAGATAANVWAYGSRTLTMTPAEIQAVAVEGTISQTRGNDWTITFTGLSFTGTNMQFAIKADRDQADAYANLLIDEGGLRYLNGTAQTGGEIIKATMTYADGTLTITVKASITAQLDPGIYHYGIQDINGSGIVNESYIGEFTITADVVRGTT